MAVSPPLEDEPALPPDDDLQYMHSMVHTATTASQSA